MRARHRLHEPEAAVDRASDEGIVALLRACRSARDRLVIVLMARAGLRRGEVPPQRAVPLDFLTVQAFDSYAFERMAVEAAAGSDFVLVNLARGQVGAPMRLDAVNDLVTAAARRVGISPPPRPHQMRHAFASNVLDAGGTLDEVQELLGHASISSTQVYAHPDPSRLRAAVDKVPSPRDTAGAAR